MRCWECEISKGRNQRIDCWFAPLYSCHDQEDLTKMINSRDKINDQIFSLRDENLELKKHKTTSEDNTKKLLFKIQKLSEQASRNGNPNHKSNLN